MVSDDDYQSSKLEENMPKTMFLSQEILFETMLFGRKYYWMKDVDGTIYLVRVDENGKPVFA